jgi:hypothetical protein
MKNASGRTPVEDCARIKELGYDISHHVQMYGERFEIVSDPVSEGSGVSIQAVSLENPKRRTLRLPVSIIVGLKDMFRGKA